MSKSATRQIHCNVCQTPVPARQPGDAFPFCSERCRLIDLGRWLDGDYRLSEPLLDRDYSVATASDDE